MQYTTIRRLHNFFLVFHALLGWLGALILPLASLYAIDRYQAHDQATSHWHQARMRHSQHQQRQALNQELQTLVSSINHFHGQTRNQPLDPRAWLTFGLNLEERPMLPPEVDQLLTVAAHGHSGAAVPYYFEPHRFELHWPAPEEPASGKNGDRSVLLTLKGRYLVLNRPGVLPNGTDAGNTATVASPAGSALP